jgi:predicted amidohydrolase
MIICPPFPILSLEDYHKTYAPDDDGLDAWILAETGKEETILTAEIDPALYRDSRKWWLEKRRRLIGKRY